jgi:hypothetical protein
MQTPLLALQQPILRFGDTAGWNASRAKSGKGNVDGSKIPILGRQFLHKYIKCDINLVVGVYY